MLKSKDAPIMAALGAAAVVGLGSEAFVASKPLQALLMRFCGGRFVCP